RRRRQRMPGEYARLKAGDDRQRGVRVERGRGVAPRQVERPAANDVVEQPQLAEDVRLEHLEQVRVTFRRKRLAMRWSPGPLVVRVADERGAWRLRSLQLQTATARTAAARVYQPLHF